jgi:hypothetical protein
MGAFGTEASFHAPLNASFKMSGHMEPAAPSAHRNNIAVFASGALIGTLGGLIGLGGAEFRLPLLINLFRFRGLEAVILNKATSLVVVATALPFRARAIPFAEVAAQCRSSSIYWQGA